ncbi:hypothetical protein ABIC33_006518 [Variovorax sp. 1140]|uniref:hypothetical protein n=1 Tax=Variovorax atrisoli TaxID=3394203 RepID=UPI00339A9E28
MLAVDYRVSPYLAVQGAVLDSIFARTGHLAHGSGLTARMLWTAPHSTLGSRLLQSDQPVSFDEIDALGKRVIELLGLGEARRARGAPRRARSSSSRLQPRGTSTTSITTSR